MNMKRMQNFSVPAQALLALPGRSAVGIRA